MRDLRTSKLKMYINVKTSCTKNASVTAAVPAFMKTVDNLSGGIDELTGLNIQLQASSIPSTIIKNEAKDSMAEKTMILVSAVKAHASVQKDSGLAAKVNFTKSHIMRSKDVDSDDVCMAIVELVRSILPQLADYGVTNKEFDAAIGAINDFSQMIGMPKSDIMNSKSLNEQMEAVFKKIDIILQEQLDNLMINFKTSHETFYKEYMSARKMPATTPAKKDDAAKKASPDGK